MPTLDWLLRTPATSPSEPSPSTNRTFCGLSYSPLLNKTLLAFGSFEGSESFNDGWLWDDVTWTQVMTNGGAGLPPKRDSAMIAWDETNDYWIVFGGQDSSVVDSNKSDTWTSPDGVTWTQHFPDNVPPARLSHGMAFCAAIGKVVLFGGFQTSSNFVNFNDTWAWDGSDWTELFPSTPPTARGDMGCCESGDGVLIFGGVDSTWPPNNGDSQDTWRFDGTEWTDVSPVTSPPSLSFVSMGASTLPGGPDVVLFGGLRIFPSFGSYVYNTDTWGWYDDTLEWVKLDPPITVQPTGNRGWSCQLAGNPIVAAPDDHRGVVLYNEVLTSDAGGVTDFHETWTFAPQPPVEIPASIRHTFGLGQ